MMKIRVAKKQDDAEKFRGDLLEDLASKILKLHNLEVISQLRNTGFEVDLLAKSRVNPKKILVECKARKELIQMEAMSTLYTSRNTNGYDEGWLLSTSELGKEAKGFVQEKLPSTKEDKYFFIYAGEKLLELIVNSKIVDHYDITKKAVEKIVGNKSDVGDFFLLVSEYGYYWATIINKSGRAYGIIFSNATSSEIIIDIDLLKNISTTDFEENKLNLTVISEFLGRQEQPNLADLKLGAAYVESIVGLGITAPGLRSEDVDLRNIFVYPDIEVITSLKFDPGEVQNSKDLLTLPRRTLIVGDDLSGKSSLAQMLQIQYNEKGFVAVYIRADDIRKHEIKKFYKILAVNLQKQYDLGEYAVDLLASFAEARCQDIILIIDDVDSIQIRLSDNKIAFLGQLFQSFPKILVLANKSYELEAVSKIETKGVYSNFDIYRIKQFGYVLRDKLIERWLQTEIDSDITDNDFHNRKIEIANKINIVVGKNFVPTFPFFLVTILSMLEVGGASKLQGSAYAELYHYLISNALITAKTRPDDLDLFHTYLSYLAFTLYEKEVKDLSEVGMQEVYESFCQKKDIQKKFLVVHDLLEKSKIIKKENGLYSFSHNYGYYYFVAKYLADNIEDLEIKNKISSIVRSIFQKENANIVIFLVHHTKSKELISSILDMATLVFAEFAPKTLSDEDVSNINKLVKQEAALFVDSQNPEEYRQKDLQNQDAHETKESPGNRDDAILKKSIDDLDIYSKVDLSIKLMDILGQITKNYYASLDGDVKIMIIDEIQSLGFRALASLLDSFEEFMPAIRQDITELIEKKKLSNQNDKEEIADKVIYRFFRVLVVVFIKQTSESIASKDLFLSVSKSLAQHPTEAFEMVNLSMRLNFPNQLNVDEIERMRNKYQKNFLLMDVLRYLVIEYLYKFETNHAIRQKVCDKLNIVFKPALALAEKK